MNSNWEAGQQHDWLSSKSTFRDGTSSHCEASPGEAGTDPERLLNWIIKFKESHKILQDIYIYQHSLPGETDNK